MENFHLSRDSAREGDRQGEGPLKVVSRIVVRVRTRCRLIWASLHLSGDSPIEGNHQGEGPP